MEKEIDLHRWYQPQAKETPVVTEPLEMPVPLEDVGTNYEEEPEFSPWTPEDQKVKKRRWGTVIGGSLCAVALLALIISTSVFFSRDHANFAKESKDSSYDEVFDFYQEYFDESSQGITGKNTIERAPTNENVQLTLISGEEEPEPLRLQELYDRCLPSVVGVRGNVGWGYSWGTGIVMTPNGYILTNTHVLDHATAAQVILYDGSEYEAKLVGADAISDVAVLKIEAAGLTAAQFGDSNALSVGDAVVAIGNPINEVFSGTMTEGIISGMSREMTYNGRTMTLLQTNAALNEGNSGGPLFNMYGQVVGITNMKVITTGTAMVEGIGFAIPSTTVKAMANAILRDGAVLGRPGLGIYALEVTGNDDHPAGIQVSSVIEGSDAAAQDLRPNDILTEIDGLTIENFDMMKEHIASLSVGDTVRLTVWREGKSIVKSVKLIDQNQF